MIQSLIARGIAALALLSCAMSAPAIANISVKDGAGATQTVCAGAQLDASQAYCFTYRNAAGAQEDLATKAQMLLLTNANGSPNDPYSIATDGSPASEIALLKGIIKTLGTAPAQAGGKVDTVVQSVATNRSAVIGFAGAQITTTSGSPTITLTTAPTAGGIQIGHIVTGTGIPAGTTVLALASGTANTANATYTLSANATAAGTGVAMTSAGPQLIMAAYASRRGWSTQNQGGYGCYTNGLGTVSLDQNSLLIPAGQYLDSKDSHVGTGAFYEQCLAAAMPQYWREW